MNFRFLIQPSETFLVELIGIHKIKLLSSFMSGSKLFTTHLGLKGPNFERLICQSENDNVMIVKGQWMSR